MKRTAFFHTSNREMVKYFTHEELVEIESMQVKQIPFRIFTKNHREE